MIARTLVLGVGMLLLAGCNRSGDAPKQPVPAQKHEMATPASDVPGKPDASAKQVVYTCVMHPDVISDKPGKCPKCGMELVLKQPTSKDAGGGSAAMPMHSH